jgi:hypothetical protein
MVLARILVSFFAGFCGIVGHWAGGFVVNTWGGLRVGAEQAGDRASLAGNI